MKKYSITLNEEQLRIISMCVEDIHRFLSGDTRLSNTALVLPHKRGMVMRSKLEELKEIVTPNLSSGEEYPWSGVGCEEEEQRKMIAKTYYIYREILHSLAVSNKVDNVYSSETLRCNESGDDIIITWKDE